MTTEALKSTAVTNLDAIPVVPNTTGEGVGGVLREVDAYVSPALLTVGSTYRMFRIPTHAKVKSVEWATDKALDSNSSPTLGLDFNIAFSDSTQDGTAASNQGAIPTNAGTGAVTTVASYSNPNLLFGTVNETSHSAAQAPTNITMNGGITYYDMTKLMNTPLWSIFGYTVDPGGMFDLLVYVSTAAATAVTTGTLWAKMTYVD